MQTLEGISDIRDESDRSGMRVVIEVGWFLFANLHNLSAFGLSVNLYWFISLFQLKRGAEPAIVLNNLYRFTALQSSFSCNMVG